MPLGPRLFLLFSFFFVGGILYMTVTRDFSRAMLAFAGALGFLSLLLGILIGRESPTAIVHLLMFVCTTVALFAAIFWWYSRDQIAAVFALVTAPPAIVLAGLSLRRRANPEAGSSSTPPHTR